MEHEKTMKRKCNQETCAAASISYTNRGFAWLINSILAIWFSLRNEPESRQLGSQYSQNWSVQAASIKNCASAWTRVVSPITLRVKGKLTSFGGCVHFGSPEMLDSKAKHADLGKKLFSTFNLHWHLKFSQETKQTTDRCICRMSVKQIGSRSPSRLMSCWATWMSNTILWLPDTSAKKWKMLFDWTWFLGS